MNSSTREMIVKKRAKKCYVTLWLTPFLPNVLFNDTFADPRPSRATLRVSRIIWMTPFDTNAAFIRSQPEFPQFFSANDSARLMGSTHPFKQESTFRPIYYDTVEVITFMSWITYYNRFLKVIKDNWIEIWGYCFNLLIVNFTLFKLYPTIKAMTSLKNDRQLHFRESYSVPS